MTFPELLLFSHFYFKNFFLKPKTRGMDETV